MKFQRNTVRRFSSALYWLLILGVVVSYFALIAERDPAPSASVSMDRVTADAPADSETRREDYDRPRVDALRAFPPHTDTYNSDDSAPLEGRRAVRSGSGQTATRRDSAPQPADLASSDSDAGGPADESGRPISRIEVVAEDVPEGRLRIERGFFPRFVVSGIQLPEGGEVDVDVVLDVGSKQVTGRVTDDLGRPLAGADITLSWVLRENSLVQDSLRKINFGANGGFGFTQVGAGAQRIIARAPGF